MPWLILLNFLWVLHYNLTNTRGTVLFTGATWLGGLPQSYWFLPATNPSNQHPGCSTQQLTLGAVLQQRSQMTRVSAAQLHSSMWTTQDFWGHIPTDPTEKKTETFRSSGCSQSSEAKNYQGLQWFKTSLLEIKKSNCLGTGGIGQESHSDTN